LWRHQSGVMPGLDAVLQAIISRCLAQDNITCDVDEVLCPDPQRGRDVVIFFCYFLSSTNVYVLLLHLLFEECKNIEKKNYFSPLFLLIVRYVWKTSIFYTFVYMCVCVFTTCMTKLYCKLQCPAHRRRKSHKCVVGASCAYSNGLCVLY
jgi:hypothetical protein